MKKIGGRPMIFFRYNATMEDDMFYVYQVKSEKSKLGKGVVMIDCSFILVDKK